jgi:flavin-dependent dehydrogenase
VAEFHYRGNSLAYVFPTSDRLTLVALSLPISEFHEFKKDATRSFLEGIRRHERVADRVRRAEIAGRVMGSGSIPSYQRRPYGNGWVLVGDAGQVMDPWSGQGMDQASTHAVLLAESLETFLSGARPWETAMGEFHDRRNAFSRKAFERTTGNAADFRPMTQAALARRGLT